MIEEGFENFSKIRAVIFVLNMCEEQSYIKMSKMILTGKHTLLIKPHEKNYMNF